jgi:hypothetical protein
MSHIEQSRASVSRRCAVADSRRSRAGDGLARLDTCPPRNGRSSTAPDRPLSGAVQYSVHHLGPRRDDWAQLVAVYELCCSGAVVPGQARNLLDGHPVG